MDDLLRDFVVETSENIEVVDNELVRFEQDPNNRAIIAQIFRLVHTIKGTCGFLGLPRLEALTHAAESAIDRFRDGATVTRDTVSLILSTIDRIKVIMAELDRSQTEPAGEDTDLIKALEAVVTATASPSGSEIASDITVGTLIYQVLERPLRPGEVSLDELERVFQETEADEPELDAAMLSNAGLTPPESSRSVMAPRLLADEHAGDTLGEQGDVSSRKSTIRVPVDTLEHLMTMVSELVLTRNQLLEISRRDENSPFKTPLQRLSHVTAELQESVMKTRMQPIGTAWSRLPRLMRDLCEELGKDIDLVTEGAETEIDRQLLELIRDPMLHMIRNAADHGIETPEERVAAGKSPRGIVKVAAAQEGGQITVLITDNGRGLDFVRIREKAVRLGLVSPTDVLKMSDQQVARFIFHAGFTTAAQVTNISGRGVGMDVVRTNIEQMGGSVEVRSAMGQGTTVQIKIPLTLAIAAALILECGGQRFALPQMAVVELVRPNGSTEARVEQIHSAPVLRLREKLLPLVHLGRALGLKQSTTLNWNEAFVVVCQVGHARFGVVVDSVLQTEEIVVKPLSSRIRNLACYSGATILGDGAVIMILDPNGLAQHIGALTEAHNDNLTDADSNGNFAGSTSSLLVFRAGQGSPKAVPLALVTRLEEIEVGRIEVANGDRVVQYRGKLMRLLPGAPDVEIRSSGNQPVLVFSSANNVIGLIVDEIVDIVEEALELGMTGDIPGLLGTAVLRGKATDIIDVAHFLPELAGRAVREERKKPRVLLVEPSEFARAMLAPVLQASGYDVQVCGAVSEALIRLNRGGYDVLISNIEMDGGLKIGERTERHLPRVGLATRPSPSALDAAANAGFRDVVGIFDRAGLLGALAGVTLNLGEAA